MPAPARLRPLYFPAILLLVITAVEGSQINGPKSRKLDETEESKCGSCPCSKPCTTPSNPPPSPPPPAPVMPPPSTGYCPPPPAPVKPPPSAKYCPPPPSSDIIYITGPPGSLYPVDQTYNKAGGRSAVVALPGVVGGGLVALLMLW